LKFALKKRINVSFFIFVGFGFLGSSRTWEGDESLLFKDSETEKNVYLNYENYETRRVKEPKKSEKVSKELVVRNKQK